MSIDLCDVVGMNEAVDDMQTDKRMACRIRRAYVLALAIIAVTTLAAFVVENMMVRKFEESSAALNVVSEQRALSQRVALFSADVMTAPNYMVQQMAANNVAQTAEKMNAAHEWMLERIDPQGEKGYLSPEIHNIFFDTPYELHKKFTRYNQKIDAFLATEGEQQKRSYNSVYFEAIGPLATSLDGAVEQLEADARHDVTNMREIRVALTVVILITLAVEWLFIFRPLARTVELKTRALEEARKSVTHAAMHDPLTDLPNRRMLDGFLPTMLAQGERMGKPLTVCHLDLDYFKNINDTLGHSIGDKVLVHATNVLRNATRGSDFIARVGGDEFLIVDCTFGGYEGAAVMADRIVEHMARPFEVDGHVCTIGASIGIAIHLPEDEDLDAIMRRADIALYHAKGLGRGQTQPYSDVALQAFESRIQRAA